jgi:hypothetical protein
MADKLTRYVLFPGRWKSHDIMAHWRANLPCEHALTAFVTVSPS